MTSLSSIFFQNMVRTRSQSTLTVRMNFNRTKKQASLSTKTPQESKKSDPAALKKAKDQAKSRRYRLKKKLHKQKNKKFVNEKRSAYGSSNTEVHVRLNRKEPSTTLHKCTNKKFGCKTQPTGPSKGCIHRGLDSTTETKSTQPRATKALIYNCGTYNRRWAVPENPWAFCVDEKLSVPPNCNWKRCSLYLLVWQWCVYVNIPIYNKRLRLLWKCR